MKTRRDKRVHVHFSENGGRVYYVVIFVHSGIYEAEELEVQDEGG